MHRIAIGIEYDGSGFHGWQAQKDASGIQTHLERALSTVAAHTIRVTCAGRTDAGVHATHQVAHFDTTAQRSERSWALGTNSHLPSAVCVCWAQMTTQEFHARFSARSRSYRYVILNRPTRSALDRSRVYCVYLPLDETRMRQAGQHLLGEHDFSSFRAAECQSKSAIRKVMRLDVRRKHDHVLVDITANAFLHHMVRNIVGVLIRIGIGEAEPDWARRVLETRDRTQAAMTAPARGLYLIDVEYPEHFGLPRGDPFRLLL